MSGTPSSEHRQEEETPPVSQSDEVPGVIAPPPLLFLGTLILGVVISHFWPLPWPDAGPLWGILAGVLVAVGALLLLLSAREFGRAGTPVPTRRPTTALVGTGPYRYSRNPIYVALSLIYLGLAVALGSLWAVLLLIPLLLLIQYGVILREEAYLTRRFGNAYSDYAEHVRRWL